GWSATCAACLGLARAKPAVMSLSNAERAIAWFGLAVGTSMALMKLIPLVPGHFTIYEWLALGVWIVLGAAAGSATWKAGHSGPRKERRAPLQGRRRRESRPEEWPFRPPQV